MERDLCAEETLVLYRLLKHVALAWKYRIWTISSGSSFCTRKYVHKVKYDNGKC